MSSPEKPKLNAIADGYTDTLDSRIELSVRKVPDALDPASGLAGCRKHVKDNFGLIDKTMVRARVNVKSDVYQYFHPMVTLVISGAVEHTCVWREPAEV